jgi:hypothetical protein
MLGGVKRGKVALVDFDGVVIRNRTVSKVVVDRIEGYVQKKLGLSKDSAGALNEILYSKHGHTLIGLQKILPHSTSLTEFNDYVYTGIQDEISHIDLSRELAAWKDFRNMLDTYQVHPVLFTNAPRAWTDLFVDSSTPNLQDITGLSEKTLKPDQYVYRVAQEAFKDKHIFFIDDKVGNLEFPRSKLKWHTLHFMHDHFEYYTVPKTSSEHFMVSNLYAAADVITLNV